MDEFEEVWGKVVLAEIISESPDRVESTGRNEKGERQRALAFKNPDFDPENDDPEREWESEIKTWWNR